MSVRSPEQLKTKAMDMLYQKNPQIAGTLKNMMNSGKTPQQSLSEMVQSGKVNRAQFNQIKQLYGQYGRFLPFKIPKREFDNMEQAFSQRNVPTQAQPTQAQPTIHKGFHF